MSARSWDRYPTAGTRGGDRQYHHHHAIAIFGQADPHTSGDLEVVLADVIARRREAAVLLPPDLEAAVGSLPPQEQEAVRLCVLERFDTRTAAAISAANAAATCPQTRDRIATWLGCPVEAVTWELVLSHALPASRVRDDLDPRKAGADHPDAAQHEVALAAAAAARQVLGVPAHSTMRRRRDRALARLRVLVQRAA